jgi:hypothetical protein
MRWSVEQTRITRQSARQIVNRVSNTLCGPVETRRLMRPLVEDDRVIVEVAHNKMVTPCFRQGQTG